MECSFLNWANQNSAFLCVFAFLSIYCNGLAASDNGNSTSLPGSLFSACLSRWNRDPGCGWSCDHLSIQNRRVGGYSSTFGREDDEIPHPSSRFFYHPDSGWSHDQLQPGSLFLRLREAEKRDPANEVDGDCETKIC